MLSSQRGEQAINESQDQIEEKNEDGTPWGLLLGAPDDPEPGCFRLAAYEQKRADLHAHLKKEKICPIGAAFQSNGSVLVKCSIGFARAKTGPLSKKRINKIRKLFGQDKAFSASLVTISRYEEKVRSAKREQVEHSGASRLGIFARSSSFRWVNHDGIAALERKAPGREKHDKFRPASLEEVDRLTHSVSDGPLGDRVDCIEFTATVKHIALSGSRNLEEHHVDQLLAKLEGKRVEKFHFFMNDLEAFTRFITSHGKELDTLALRAIPASVSMLNEVVKCGLELKELQFEGKWQKEPTPLKKLKRRKSLKICEYTPPQVLSGPVCGEIQSVTIPLNLNAEAIAKHNTPLDKWELRKIWQMTTGEGIRVAVLDTGVNGNHPLLAPKLGPSKSFSFIGQATCDPNGHGTHVASLVCGESVQGKLVGVAPNVQLLVGQTSNGGQSPIASLCAGITWAVEENADVISMSLGSVQNDPKLYQVVHETLARGKIIVCAAANRGKNFRDNIAFPAQYGGVICVGSHDADGHTSTFSSTGREVDILAPGELILGAQGKDQMTLASGTSSATPLVAGLVALILAFDRKRRNQIKNTSQVKTLLRAVSTNPGNHTSGSGHGVLEPLKLFKTEDQFYGFLEPAEYFP